MRKFLLHILATSVLLTALSGCTKEEEGDFTVVFRATYLNQPLAMFDYHDYGFGQRIQFTRSDLMISDLRLKRADGSFIDLMDIGLVEMNHDDPAAAQRGTELSFNNVPAGTYESLEFGVGVQPTLNATEPADYSASHPLSDPGRYWLPWTSYIFTKTEGNLDTIPDGTDNPDLGFAYHTGTDALYFVVSAVAPVEIVDEMESRIVFALDHADLLGYPSTPVDIRAKPQNHNPQDTVQIKAILNNYQGALTFFVE